ncbi:hypothetical protein [Companilactobacillus ginsenosidimutans]|nr:hypothetical protein [Companilactobacillus ginsenosidimutans]
MLAANQIIVHELKMMQRQAQSSKKNQDNCCDLNKGVKNLSDLLMTIKEL